MTIIKVGRTLGSRHPDISNVGRDARLCGRNSVLDLDLRDIEIGAKFEVTSI